MGRRGSKTPTEDVAKFREAYLRTGNAAESARAINACPNTGCKLAREAHKDPDFARARAELLARGLTDVESMLLEATTIALERIRKEAPEAEDIAKLIQKYDLKSLNYHDPRPAYFSALVNAHRTLKSKAADAEEKPTQVVVHVTTRDDDDSDDTPEPEPSAE